MGTGEAHIRTSAADLCPILSVENRAGAPSHDSLPKKDLRHDIAFRKSASAFPGERRGNREINHSLDARNGANIGSCAGQPWSPPWESAAASVSSPRVRDVLASPLQQYLQSVRYPTNRRARL